MKRTLLLSVLSALSFGVMQEMHAAVNPSRVLVSVSGYGDFMGSTPDTQLTSQRLYLYNQDLQVVAVIETACGSKSKELYTQYYNPYVYDEQGRLVKKDRYQYGLYDFGDRAMHAAAGMVEYRYDEAGNCIEEVEDQNTITYTYDADGNCIKEVHFKSGSETKTLEFSDFSAGKNLPGLIVSTHTNETFTGEFYEESREYDAEGRILKTTRICNRDYVEDHGIWQITTSAGDFMQEEHWTYEEGSLALYEKFTNMDEETGELIPYLKTVYTVKDANTIGYQSYTSYGKDWYKSGIYQEETYLDFTDKAAQTSLQLVSVKKSAEGMNDALVEFTQPALVESNAIVSFNIYRNGEIIRNIAYTDAQDEGNDLYINGNGNLVYADHNVYSGQYDYMVQTVIDSEQHAYCVSDIEQVDLTLAFPAASNLRPIESVKDQNDLNYVTVLFDVPYHAADYGFVSNELILGNNQIGEETSKDPMGNILHCTIFDDKATVSILTRYELGKAVSERYEIDIHNLSSIEEIRALEGDDQRIFDLNGRPVNTPLERLHGQYILIKGQKVYKVNLN